MASYSKLKCFIQVNSFESVVWKLTAFCLDISELTKVFKVLIKSCSMGTLHPINQSIDCSKGVDKGCHWILFLECTYIPTWPQPGASDNQVNAITWWCPGSFPFHVIISMIMMTSWHVSELWCFLVVCPSKLLNKQSSCQWLETPWRLCDVSVLLFLLYVVVRMISPHCGIWRQRFGVNIGSGNGLVPDLSPVAICGS